MGTIGVIDFFAVLCSSLLLYSAYTLFMVLIGLKTAYHRAPKTTPQETKPIEYPFFSIILPMKNEEKVAKRVLEALLELDYPPHRVEIIIVEDASTDQTPKICRAYAERAPERIHYLHRDVSSGKPAALNYGLTHAKGDIIGVLDADSVPEPTLLTRAAKRFEEKEIVAVQGQLRSINPKETLLSNLVSYERIMYLHLYTLGKERAGLFVPFAGTNLFIRRQVLTEVGAWREEALSEDLELAARLMQAQHTVKYAPEIVTWQETPATYRQLMTQRTRWYRGCMEVAIQYGRLLKHRQTVTLDAELFFFGPFTMMLAFITSFLYSLLFIPPPQLSSSSILITQASGILAVLLITVWGLVLANSAKPRTVSNLKWLPLVYLFCAFQGFIATFAFGLLVLRRPRNWRKTEKTGTITIKKQGTRVSNCFGAAKR